MSRWRGPYHIQCPLREETWLSHLESHSGKFFLIFFYMAVYSNAACKTKHSDKSVLISSCFFLYHLVTGFIFIQCDLYAHTRSHKHAHVHRTNPEWTGNICGQDKFALLSQCMYNEKLLPLPCFHFWSHPLSNSPGLLFCLIIVGLVWDP